MDGSGTADRVDRAAVSTGDSAAGATHTREVDPLTVTQRLQREGRWSEIEPERNEMMKPARKQGMSKRDAQAWVYSELDRLYPPSDPSPDKTPGEGIDQAVPRDSGQIRGLGDIPTGWPELPANASLSSEVS